MKKETEYKLARRYPEVFGDKRSRPSIPYGKPIDWLGRNPLAPRHDKVWTSQENTVLVNMAVYQKYPMGAIAQTLGRKEEEGWSRLHKLGYAEVDYEGQYQIKDKTSLVINESTQIKSERTNIVNINHLITLLQKGYTTINVRFQPKTVSAQMYTYKVAESVAKTLSPGDMVIVEVRDELKFAEVVHIHDKPKIDVKAPYALKWIVQKIDRAPYDDQVRREAEAVEKLQDAEREKAQREALDVLLQGVDREQFLKLLNGDASE